MDIQCSLLFVYPFIHFLSARDKCCSLSLTELSEATRGFMYSEKNTIATDMTAKMPHQKRL